MKFYLTIMGAIFFVVNANATLTTGQKLQCAKSAIQAVGGEELSLVSESVNIKRNPFDKYNVVGKVIEAVTNERSEKDYVYFLMQDPHGQMFYGMTPINFEEVTDHSPHNNTTVSSQDLYSGKQWTCSLVKSNFGDIKEKNEDLTLTDLNLQLYGKR